MYIWCLRANRDLVQGKKSLYSRKQYLFDRLYVYLELQRMLSCAHARRVRPRSGLAVSPTYNFSQSLTVGMSEEGCIASRGVLLYC